MLKNFIQNYASMWLDYKTEERDSRP